MTERERNSGRDDRQRRGGYGQDHLDDRTGATPGSPGGYETARARYPEDRYDHDDRDYEERSFRPSQDYPREDRGSYTPEFGAQDSGFRPPAGRMRHTRGAGYTAEADYGSPRPRGADMRDGDHRRSMQRGSSAGYPGSPYESWGVSSGFGFGRDLDGDPGPDRSARDRGAPTSRDFWDRAGDEVASWFGDDEAQARRESDKRQSHAGRGPKGYTRSDGRIEEDVCEHLSQDHWLDASDVEVKVKDREVTLDGKVASRADKRRAEMCAEAVSGVTHVQNNLRVDSPMQNSDRGVHETAVQPVGGFDTMAKQTSAKA